MEVPRHAESKHASAENESRLVVAVDGDVREDKADKDAKASIRRKTLGAPSGLAGHWAECQGTRCKSEMWHCETAMRRVKVASHLTGV